jgi:hypothetical protein
MMATRGESSANAGAPKPASGAPKRPRYLYLVEWQGSVGWDMYDALVVRARDSQHALEIALKAVGPTTGQTDATLWKVRTLREQGTLGVVLASFNAG